MRETVSCKALTLHQPWATIIALGLKHVETRSWPTAYRGRLAIHAGRAPLDPGMTIVCAALAEAGLAVTVHQVEMARYPLGAIVAFCDLVDCVPMTDETIREARLVERCVGDWQPGRFAWHLDNIVPVDPIPMRGAQGLWDCELPA
jgi:hypothetical protein